MVYEHIIFGPDESKHVVLGEKLKAELRKEIQRIVAEWKSTHSADGKRAL